MCNYEFMVVMKTFISLDDSSLEMDTNNIYNGYIVKER